MKKILTIVLLLAITLAAKDYRTQQERCLQIKDELIAEYHYYTKQTMYSLDKKTTMASYDYYIKPTLEDIIKKRKQMEKDCDLQNNPAKTNRGIIGGLKYHIAEQTKIKNYKGEKGYHNVVRFDKDGKKIK